VVKEGKQDDGTMKTCFQAISMRDDNGCNPLEQELRYVDGVTVLVWSERGSECAVGNSLGQRRCNLPATNVTTSAIRSWMPRS
jgi:hypothetical protein